MRGRSISQYKPSRGNERGRYLLPRGNGPSSSGLGSLLKCVRNLLLTLMVMFLIVGGMATWYLHFEDGLSWRDAFSYIGWEVELNIGCPFVLLSEEEFWAIRGMQVRSESPVRTAEVCEILGR
jgi:hypothetical protein